MPNIFNICDTFHDNSEFQILPSAIRAVTTLSQDIEIHNASAFMALINVTAIPGVQTLTMSLEGKDPVTGLYTQILTGAATAAAGAYGLHINAAVVSAAWSGLVAAGSNFLSTFLPHTLRIRIVHSGGGNWTYSIAGFIRK